jgi:hypothetical protein
MDDQTSDKSEPWYGAQMVFRHPSGGSRTVDSYEERIVLIRADSEEEAITKAEVEASEYCHGSDTEYTGFVRVFHIFEEAIRDKTEVFSIIRDSELSPKDYLDHFFDTGSEYERHMGES